MSDIEEDYLEVDRKIPGQNYVCLSFLSPEKILEDKKLFNLFNFYQDLGKNEDNLTFSEFKEKFLDFSDLNEKKLQNEFDKLCDFKTNVRGIKIRGVYDSEREANIRAKVLQKLDNSFHVYVGQVGFWLPWDPNPNNIENQEYLNKDLNRLTQEYNKNQMKKDIFFEEQKKEKKKAALLENEKRKEENKKLQDAEKEDAEKEDAGQIEAESISEKNLEEALNDIDPWMKNKLEKELNKE